MIASAAEPAASAPRSGGARLLAPMARAATRVGLYGYEPTEPETLARQITRKWRGRLITVALLATMGVLAIPASTFTGEPLLWTAAVAALLSAAIVLVTPVPRMHPAWFHALPVLILAPWALGVVFLAPDGGTIASSLVFMGPTIAFVIEGVWQRAMQWVLTALVVAGLILFADTNAATDAALLAGLLCAFGLAGFIHLVWWHAEEQATMLEHLVRRDPLTGVGNRRMLGERLDYELARHGRSGLPLTLLVLDLNGFKQVNDRLGHGAGDQLLREVGAVLAGTLRGQDTVARPGGDEFCIVAPETSAEDAAGLVAQIRGALATLAAAGRPLTTAVGVATFPQDGVAVRDLMAIADERQRADKLQSSVGLPDATPPQGFRRPAPLELPVSVPLPSGEEDHVPLGRRVLRQPHVKVAVMAVYLIGALAAAIGSRMVDEPSLMLMVPLAIAVGLFMRFVPTDRIPAWLFNAGPLIATAVVAAGAALAGEAWFVVAPFFMFTGAAIGFMVETRRERLVQTALASAIITLPILYVPSDVTTVAVIASLVGLYAMEAYIGLSWELVEEQAEELGRLMRSDPLTGVGNRRLLVERLDYELVRHRRTGRKLTLLVLDLNDFKGVNDTLGHLAGDEVLKAAAAALRRAVRRQDTVARQGGDEFGILVPETGSAEAERIVAHVRAALGSVDAGGRSLAGAVGYAVFPDDAIERDALVEVADHRQRADKGPRVSAASLTPRRGPAVWRPGVDVPGV